MKFYHNNKDFRQIFVEALSSPIKFLTQKKQVNHVLDSINLEIFEGDRVGILGVNGSGKSTLCRQIAGMGKKNNFVKTSDVKAILNTNVGAFPELTGRENIEILVHLLYTNLSKEEKRKIVDDAVSFSEIEEFIDTPFKNYSKGMKARTFLSAISSTPSDLLILDEVFDGADTFFSTKVAQRVKKMIALSGAVIFISHDLENIREICNRVLVLHMGQVIFDGDVVEGIKSYLLNCRPELSEI
ncbi:ATP-binding cassette domain-containing protein [Halobacteriovorax sp. JY17]|uniref:ABC transporter ATP-binding protein n=1 Tax=Halobacteriovorax sp. JY17 TaxID=2014617 RepID=UPI0025C54277|nr:ATP-binding cassette domain-containing protein [Halobacteriovorax sp. JY17]